RGRAVSLPPPCANPLIFWLKRLLRSKRERPPAVSPTALLRFGSPGRTRTSDQAVNSRSLYQLSYRGSGRPSARAQPPGGRKRNRTAVRGFAVLCIATLPSGQLASPAYRRVPRIRSSIAHGARTCCRVPVRSIYSLVQSFLKSREKWRVSPLKIVLSKCQTDSSSCCSPPSVRVKSPPAPRCRSTATTTRTPSLRCARLPTRRLRSII